jgi:hypothetical protein
LMLFREAFHAPTLAQQEKAQELMESSQECGEKWRGSFTKYSPDSCSWKTHQCSLLGDLEEFSETWPKWGLMRNGECWEQPMLVQTTNVTGYGLSPTPPPPRHLAYTNSFRRRWRNELKQSERDSSRQSISVSSEIVSREMAYTNSTYGKRNQCTKRSFKERTIYGESSWWSVEPNMGRVADGVAARVDRLKAIGNGQVPLCAATAWRLLNDF